MIKLINSFKCAINGIINSVMVGRNLRIQICIGILVMCLMPFFVRSRAESAVLIFAVILIPTMEIINTSIENMIDLICPEYNRIAGAAKDAAAGAVLLCALGAVFVGVLFFANTSDWVRLFNYSWAHMWYPAVLIFEVILGLIFIFANFGCKKNVIIIENENSN